MSKRINNKQNYMSLLHKIIYTLVAMIFVLIFSATISHAACCQVINRWGETKYYDTFSEGWCYVVHAADSNPKTMTTIKLLSNWEASKEKIKITARGEKYTVGKYNLGENLARKHVEGLDNSKSKVDAFSGGHLNVKNKKRITIDLNGFNIDRRRGNDQNDDGELINVSENAFLQIIDSNPSVSKNIDGVETKGGCLMGGASEDGAGGIHIKGGAFVQMKGGNICCNQTCEHGGAIFLNNSSSKLLLDGVHIFNNKTRDSKDNTNGAGIYINEGSARIRNCIFRNNESEDYGGAIFTDEANAYVVIENSKFIGNKANDNSGGAIYIDRGNLKVKNTTFDGNYAHEYGGAIYVEDDDGAVIRDSIFIKNKADKNGGGFYADDDEIHFLNCDFHENIAGKNGGGIYLDNDADISFQGLMKVYKNYGEGNRDDDVYFEPKSYLYSGGLLEDSKIGVRSKKSFNAIKNITKYEYQQFFFSNSGKFKTEKKSEKDESYFASVFIKNNIYVFVVMILIIAIGAISGIIIRNKKKELKKE